MYRLLTVLVTCLFFVSGCSEFFGPPAFYEEDDLARKDATLNDWTYVGNDDSGTLYEFRGSGTFYVQIATGADYWMFPRSDAGIRLYRGVEGELVSSGDFRGGRADTEDWRDAVFFTVSEETDLYLEFVGEIGAYLLMTAEAYVPVDHLAPFPAHEFSAGDAVVEISAPPSGALSDNSFTVETEPQGAILAWTTNGTDPEILREPGLGGARVTSGGHVAPVVSSFSATLRFKAFYFESESEIVERSYVFESLRLRQVPASIEFHPGNRLVIDSRFGSALGGFEDTGTLVFSRAGTAQLQLTESSSGTFRYRVITDGTPGSWRSIPSSGVEIAVDTSVEIGLSISQGIYWGPGTEYSVSAEFE